MGFSDAVQWWDEWQLRILVLCSQFLQCFLFFAGALRKRRIPSFLRFLIWLAYLGSDGIAIYALAALFNRTKKQEWLFSHRNSASLQVLWAPMLLVHLGGQNGITAYNIEDNELWRRHVLTAVSQVTVAIYVFCKLWSGNRPILHQGIFLFIFGIFKCILKPFDLKKVSINSLVESSRSEENDETHSLHQYVRSAAQYFEAEHGGHQQLSDSSEDNNPLEVDKGYDLFVDLAPSYSDRLTCLKYLVHRGENAHRLLQSCLSAKFDRLYTKEVPQRIGSSYISNFLNWSNYIRAIAASSLLYAMVSLHKSRKKEAYNSIDVKITYTLLSCTAILEYVIATMTIIINAYKCLRCVVTIHRMIHRRPWPDLVGQYNLIGYLARNKRHSWFRKLAALFVCKDYIDRLWQMKPPKSSSEITKLVYGYIAKGWTEHHINNIATYRAFNDNRGNWTLQQEGCRASLEWSLQRQFDESILLWHLATDFCFQLTETTPINETASRCRAMSNYMAYLLFVNPEMLLTGARRSLFRAAYKQLKRTVELIPQPDTAGPSRQESQLARMIAQNIQRANGRANVAIIQDACKLANDLKNLCTRQNDGKMWRVIQGVWVEMLCFSAARCRGYLHAKSLGQGGEYLSYIWLLMNYMGMETLAEKMQRASNLEPDNGGNANGTTAASPATTATGAGGDGIREASPVMATGGGEDDGITEVPSSVEVTGGAGDGTTIASPV